MSTEVARTEVGHWAAGVSGNPGGYSKEKRQAVARVADIAREHTPQAIATLASIMNDHEAARNTRIAAANALLDRAWGRPPQSVELSGGAIFDNEEPPNAIELARQIAFALSLGAHESEERNRAQTEAVRTQSIKMSADPM